MDYSIQQLFLKYIQNRASAQEINQVIELMRADQYDQEWDAAMMAHEADFEMPSQDFQLPDQGRLYQKIKNKTILKSSRPSLKWIGYAAAVLLIGFTALWVSSPTTGLEETAKNAAKTPVKNTSERKWIKLPDGTSVQLNLNSRLEYADSFEGQKTREVTLFGEAFFDVVHDSAHPFIIHTGKITTTVLGTAFNISAYNTDKAVTVTVTRGKVKVTEANKTLAILTPNQQLSWDAARIVSTKKTVNSENAIAWKAQDLIMDNITLAEAATLLTKRFKVQVFFKSEEVKSCRFTAAFLNRNDLGQITQVLSSITGAHFELKENQLLVEGPGCQN